MDDEWLAIFLLSGLTDDYLPLIMSMESSTNSTTKLSSDTVKTKLLQEPMTNTTSSEQTALFAKGKNRFRKSNNIVCYSCKGKGHKANRCPEKANKSSSEKHNNRSSDDKAMVVSD